jgi:hypothetical protein
MSIEMIAWILLGVIALGLLAVAGLLVLGVYLGWFLMGPTGSAAKDNFRFTVDADRIRKDKNAGPSTSDLKGLVHGTAEGGQRC